MKGIILAGGSGTRLYPLTKVTSKQLLPVYDKPMIYYPLSVLMDAKIKDILIISTPEDTPRFEALLGDGHQFGVQLSYAVQASPDGLAQAFIIGEEFIGDDCVAMVLGDNIFAGHGFKKRLHAAVENAEQKKEATVFGYYVDDPERFGVVEFDQDGKAVSLEEKPEHPKSNLASMGIYIFNWKLLRKKLVADMKDPDSNHDFGKDIIPTLLNDGKKLYAYKFKGYWKDVGTIDSLWEANMDLLSKNNELDLNDPTWKIYTEDATALPQYIGPDAEINHAFVNQGCVIEGEITNSVLFTGTKVGKGAKIIDSVLMPGVVVDENAVVTRALVADNVKIGAGAVVGDAKSEHIELISKRVKGVE